MRAKKGEKREDISPSSPCLLAISFAHIPRLSRPFLLFIASSKSTQWNVNHPFHLTPRLYSLLAPIHSTLTQSTTPSGHTPPPPHPKMRQIVPTQAIHLNPHQPTRPPTHPPTLLNQLPPHHIKHIQGNRGHKRHAHKHTSRHPTPKPHRVKGLQFLLVLGACGQVFDEGDA